MPTETERITLLLGAVGGGAHVALSGCLTNIIVFFWSSAIEAPASCSLSRSRNGSASTCHYLAVTVTTTVLGSLVGLMYDVTKIIVVLVTVEGGGGTHRVSPGLSQYCGAGSPFPGHMPARRLSPSPHTNSPAVWVGHGMYVTTSCVVSPPTPIRGSKRAESVSDTARVGIAAVAVVVGTISYKTKVVEAGSLAWSCLNRAPSLTAGALSTYGW